LGVAEFHLEDLDPTISDPRIRQICAEILLRGLKITWKIAAGTKVETMRNEETIDLMAQAGCRYISISPETGSPRLLKLMRKPFDLAHAVRLVRRMNQVNIRSQACFVLGYPGETEKEFMETLAFVQEMDFAGGHVFTYSARHGTAVARMPGQVPHPIRKERNARLRDLLSVSANKYQRRFLGKTLPVLWESATSLGSTTWHLSGLTDNYLRVSAEAPRHLWNQVTPVRISGCQKPSLKWRVVSGSLCQSSSICAIS